MSENCVYFESGGSPVWMPASEYKLMCDLIETHTTNILNHLIWGIPYPTKEPEPGDDVKLAYVEIDDKKIMIGVDNKTLQGYEMNDNIPTVKKPLVPLKYNKFIRWCTLMDV